MFCYSYSICIRQEKGRCCVKYSLCDTDAAFADSTSFEIDESADAGKGKTGDDW